jgi:hypothetical protein
VSEHRGTTDHPETVLLPLRERNFSDPYRTVAVLIGGKSLPDSAALVMAHPAILSVTAGA